MKTQETSNKSDKNNKRHILGYILVIVIWLLCVSIGIISQTTDKIGYSQTLKNSVDMSLKVKYDDIEAYLLAKLNIFDATQFNTKKLIAPGSYGKYKLLVENLTDKELIYDIQLNEINNYNLKLKYKLKIENVCLSGREDEWKNANEIRVKDMSIAPRETVYYTIYWTWLGDEEELIKKKTNEFLEYTLCAGIYAQYKEGN